MTKKRINVCLMLHFVFYMQRTAWLGKSAFFIVAGKRYNFMKIIYFS